VPVVCVVVTFDVLQHDLGAFPVCDTNHSHSPTGLPSQICGCRCVLASSKNRNIVILLFSSFAHCLYDLMYPIKKSISVSSIFSSKANRMRIL
jgi:hypothetical protein